MARKRPTKTSGDYATGVAYPFRGDPDGGLSIGQGNDYIATQVMLTVTPNESDNPFQDLGLEGPNFENPEDSSWRSAIRARIRRQFGELELNGLARLDGIQFDQGDGDGNTEMTIIYVNLETREQSDISLVVDSQGQIPMSAIAAALGSGLTGGGRGL